jgi:hypothetical protein
MEIHKYSVQHFAGGKNAYTLRARIDLYDKGDAHIGYIRFHKNAESMPAHDKKTSTLIVCNYPAHQYLEVLDVLRNERPLYLIYSDQRQIGSIATSHEPIGEEEISAD